MVYAMPSPSTAARTARSGSLTITRPSTEIRRDCDCARTAIRKRCRYPPCEIECSCAGRDHRARAAAAAAQSKPAHQRPPPSLAPSPEPQSCRPAPARAAQSRRRSLRYEVDRRVAHRKLQMDFRVRRQKAFPDRCDDRRRRQVQRVNPQPPHGALPRLCSYSSRAPVI